MRAVVCWEEQPMTPSSWPAALSSSWLVALPSKWTTTPSSSRSAGEGGPVRMEFRPRWRGRHLRRGVGGAGNSVGPGCGLLRRSDRGRVSTAARVVEVERGKKMVKIRCHGMTSKHESVLTTFFHSIYQFHLYPNNSLGIGT
jgi:hypothetical protein